MSETIGSRFKKAWNIFFNKDPTDLYRRDWGEAFYSRPDRPRLTGGNERSIITAIYNRIALDVASIDFRHVVLDDQGRYMKDRNSPLNDCLTLRANLDQTSRAFIQDLAMSMMDEGCVAAVPVETDVNPRKGSFDVLSLRTGKIVEWHPSAVKAKLYNERTGRQEEVMVEKLTTGIIENPFYAVMNDRNSTMQRLVRKLNLLDVVDDKLGSSKLDLIIQLPYVVKGDLKKKQAEERRQALEKQLEGSKLGIGYIDGTEKVTQLNRPIENNLLKQVEYLTNLLFSQLGITQGILDGSADENTMNNYITRTVEPFAAAIADEMKFKFLTKTARTQGQSIEYFRDPFRLIPVSQMAEIGDKMRRNEIMTSNEIRQKIGMKPNKEQRADELANPNLAKSKEAEAAMLGQSGKPQEPPE